MKLKIDPTLARRLAQASQMVYGRTLLKDDDPWRQYDGDGDGGGCAADFSGGHRVTRGDGYNSDGNGYGVGRDQTNPTTPCDVIGLLSEIKA